jgi:branched-chain amino acid transport system permease protein
VSNRRGFRQERVDRGVAVRARDVFALASARDLAWLLVPRVLPVVALLAFPLLGSRVSGYGQTVMLNAS